MFSNRNAVTLMIDSGVGGLSVLSLAHQRLPEEDFIFYADAANAPYGDKTPGEIRELLHNILHEHEDRQVKAILLACNTATSAAAKLLRAELDIPVIGMEPALKPAVLNSDGQIIVMATRLTIREEKFRDLLSRYGAGRDIVPLACPGLMQLVEEGPLSENTEKYIREMLEPYSGTMAAIVLGCTHYVFLRPLLEKNYPHVRLFDGNDGVVRHLKTVLDEKKITGGTGAVEIRCSLPREDERNAYLEKSREMLAFCSRFYTME